MQRQFAVLAVRHPIEDVVLIGVLADYHQQAAVKAKQGNPDQARADLRGTQAVSERIAAGELRTVVRVSEQPVQALLDWMADRPDDAVGRLSAALADARDLAAHHGHDYLTGRRFHLAANVARVQISTGRDDVARSVLNDLWAAMAGERERWPFGAGEQLDVPLTGNTRTIIGAQLTRLGHRLATSDEHV